MLIALHKPYGVLSQFTGGAAGAKTLAEFRLPANVYPIGRLDLDSEGLLLLSDEPALNEQLLHPSHGHEREYWCQVERVPTPAALGALEGGVVIQGRRTRPCRARILDPQPDMAARVPTIRARAAIATCWMALTLVEGRNRQVRRMTASVGFPTLRLIRVAIGALRLDDLAPGAWRLVTARERARLLER